jgi:hypothetical protein
MLSLRSAFWQGDEGQFTKIMAMTDRGGGGYLLISLLLDLKVIHVFTGV